MKKQELLLVEVTHGVVGRETTEAGTTLEFPRRVPTIALPAAAQTRAKADGQPGVRATARGPYIKVHPHLERNQAKDFFVSREVEAGDCSERTNNKKSFAMASVLFRLHLLYFFTNDEKYSMFSFSLIKNARGLM